MSRKMFVNGFINRLVALSLSIILLIAAFPVFVYSEEVQPGIIFTNPVDTQKISGNVNIEIDVTDENVKKIKYEIDNLLLTESYDVTASVELDTSQYPNGNHTLSVHGFNDNDDELTSAYNQIAVIIDNIKPKFNSVIPYPRSYSFSPNGDSVQEGVSLSFKFSESVNISASISTSSTQNILKQWNINNVLLYKTSWNGKNQAGIIQPNGKYVFNVEITDPAGNINKFKKYIFINNSIYKPRIVNRTFSPNGDRVADKQFINVYLRKSVNIQLTVKKKDKTVSYVKYGKKTKGKYQLVFKGKTSKGTWLPHGTYTLNIIGKNEFGTIIVPYTIHVDRSAPKIKKVSNQNKIYPFKDNFNDTSNVNVDVSEPSTVIIHVDGTVGKGVKTTFRTGIFRRKTKVRWRWDGRNKDGITVPSGRYTLNVQAKDSYGNKRIQKSYIQVDSSIRNIPKGFYIDKITIDLSRQVLTTYSAKGKVLFGIFISSGKQSSPTPTGSYKVIYKRGRLVTETGVYAYWPIYFRHRYAVHGWPKTPSGWPLRGKPGRPLSKGCVRSEDNYAKLMWNSTKVGKTKIIITR